MNVHHDIVRGVRLGAIGLVLVFAAAIVYRVVHLVPAPAAAKSAPTPESVAQVPPAFPDLSAGVTPPVPPPPPLKRAATKPVARAASVRPVNDAPEPAVEPPAENEKADTATPEKADEATPPEQADEATSPEPPERYALPAESRGKKIVKAVGRFLHIGGKKETPAENLKPKNQ